MTLCLWKRCEMSEWHFQRWTSGLGSFFKVPEHQSAAGFLWSGQDRGHRRTQRGKIPFELAVCHHSRVVMTLPTFLNSAHIFKSCYGSSTGLFSLLDCIGNQPNRFVCLYSTPRIFYTLTTSCIMQRSAVTAFYLRFDCSLKEVSPLSLRKCWENCRWRAYFESAVVKSDMLTMWLQRPVWHHCFLVREV